MFDVSGTPTQVGVNLKQGYNGDLTSKQAGSIGGQMVRNMCPERITKVSRRERTQAGHCMEITYVWAVG